VKDPTQDGTPMPRTNTPGSERGATLIEFSIVMPLLLLIMIAVMETGIALRDRFVVASAVGDGARVAAFQGNDPDADCSVLAAMAGYFGDDLDQVGQIEIFKADSNGNQIPSATNSYSHSAGDPTDCDTWSKSVKWPSTSRQVFVGSTALDIVGVRVEYERSWITGFPPFSGEFTIDESAVNRIEPEAFE
jgi:hypothetical protein